MEYRMAAGLADEWSDRILPERQSQLAPPGRAHRAGIGFPIALLLALAGGNDARATTVPLFDHVVVVVMENKPYSAIIGNPDSAYVNALAAQGAIFTESFAVTHPSQPNYLAMFSGSSQGVVNNDCPQDFVGVDNLGAQLIAAGKSFIGYSEDLPATGFTGCSSAMYVRKHNPWVDFDNIAAASNQPFTAFPLDYHALPDVAFVIPNQCNNTHDCPIATGDAWLQANIDAYAQWAKVHNSLLVLTWDEDDSSEGNRIVTLFVGAHVMAGAYAEPTGHYRTLATLEAMHGLAPLGGAIGLSPITDVWDELIFANGFENSPP
jgi:phosphatidylinositol-3-phosphatase